MLHLDFNFQSLICKKMRFYGLGEHVRANNFARKRIFCLNITAGIDANQVWYLARGATCTPFW